MISLEFNFVNSIKHFYLLEGLNCLMTHKNNLTAVESSKYYQSSSRLRHKRKNQLTNWSTLFIALIVALITVGFINTINRRAERSSQTQILLIYIREQLIQLSALEWQAIAEKS